LQLLDLRVDKRLGIGVEIRTGNKQIHIAGGIFYEITLFLL
jgi:hypothetical protein